MTETEPKPSISFDEVLSALLDTGTPFPPIYLHRFSDLDQKEIRELKKIWDQVNTDRRAALLIDLEELAEADTLVNFDEISRLALTDGDPRARSTAVRLLWESEDPQLIPTFLQMMQSDPDAIVRASAATSLGTFVYTGELEEIPEDALNQTVDELLKVASGKDEPLVRRRALESLGFSGRPEVTPQIKAAYHREDPEWRASALFAMGRSADAVWQQYVLESLEDPEPEVLVEAVRAAGALELKITQPLLMQMIEDPTQLDTDLYAAVVWSLSQIGGEGVRERLDELLDETEDEEEMGFLESAIDNLEFTEGFDLFDMLDVEPRDEDDLDSLIDLNDNGKE